jgi:hypothetical protein
LIIIGIIAINRKVELETLEELETFEELETIEELEELGH